MELENFEIYKATENDLSLIEDLIKGLATYEKRPQDVTGTREMLKYWLLDRKIATTLIAKLGDTVVGYALYYPVFGSFSALGKIHIEDLFLKKEYRGKGLGKQLFFGVAKQAKSEGFSAMEWSCLDWNTPSIAFYEKIGAELETGRKYFEFSLENID